jgi:hypothetical protein
MIGCTSDNINTLTLEEIINSSIQSDGELYNTNNKGYKYFLPNEFSVHKDKDFIQELVSKNNLYYLNVDIVSYYYKNTMTTTHDYNDFEYFEFVKDDKNGYLKITKNNDYFFVELCYNYAIIEVEVKEDEIRYAVSRSIDILKSIKYNELVIEKYINDNDLDSTETVYKIPEPKNKDESKNILQYIEEYDEEED